MEDLKVNVSVIKGAKVNNNSPPYQANTGIAVGRYVMVMQSESTFNSTSWQGSTYCTKWQ